MPVDVPGRVRWAGWAVAFVLLAFPSPAARWTLVQFGTNDVASVTPHGDWTEILRDRLHTRYVDPDGQPVHAGLVETPDLPEGRWAWFGIRGTTPIQLAPGHRVIATFFNRSEEYAFLVARVSFTDPDAPDPADAEHAWFTLQNGRYRDDGDWMPPGELVELEFAVADAGRGNVRNGPASTGAYRLINLSKPYNDPHFVLTRIELADDADRCPPLRPEGLTAGIHATTPGIAGNVVRLRWNPASDCATSATGISRYLVYRDGVLHDSVDRRTTAFLGTSLEYIDLEVAPGSTHAYELSAVDGALGGTYPLPGRMEFRVGNEGPRAGPVAITLPAWTAPALFDPHSQLEYLGGFRLPPDTQTDFEESASALTFHPDGNPDRDVAGSAEQTGSLFLYTHFSRAIAEISIPRPSPSSNVADWPRARLLRGPVDLWPVVYESQGQPTSVPPGGTDYRVAGLGYHPASGGLPALLYYGHCNFYGSEATAPGHGWFALDLQSSGGPWFIGAPPPHQIYPGLASRLVFAIPADWAARHTGGRSVVLGDTFLSGGQIVANGPSLYAVAPWETGRLPVPGEAVSAVEMLRYSDAPALEHRVLNFRIDQFGQGAAWLVAGRRSALAIAYRRAQGDIWYGDSLGNNDAYHDLPEPDFGDKGAGATRWKAGLMFYNPEDLAAVCAGTTPAWVPQPYAVFDLDAFSRRPDGADGQAGGLAYDTSGNHLFYIEHNGDPESPSQPLIHVWHLREVLEPPRLSLGLRRDGTRLVLTWSPGATPPLPRLQAADVLDADGWIDLGIGTAGAPTPAPADTVAVREHAVDAAATGPARFFRLFRPTSE